MTRPKPTVLCICDSWNELVARKQLLESNDYRVLAAGDRDEALRQFRDNRVSVVVLEYQMPGYTGDVLAARLKRMKPEVPVVMLSSFWPLPQNKLTFVDIFLTKAQEQEELVSSISGLLEARPKPFFNQWLDIWRGRNRVVVR